MEVTRPLLIVAWAVAWVVAPPPTKVTAGIAVYPLPAYSTLIDSTVIVDVVSVAKAAAWLGCSLR